MDWLPLALLSAFSLASSDAVTKRHLSSLRAGELVFARFVWTALLLTPALFLAPSLHLPLAFWAMIAVAVPLELLAMAMYMSAIRENPLSLTLPYLAFTPAITVVTGYLILGETVSARGVAGIALVVAGAWLLNLPLRTRPADFRWWSPFTAMIHQRGARLMMGVAAIYAITAVLSKAVLAHGPAMTVGPLYFLCVGLGALLLGLFRSGAASLDALRVRPGWGLLAGVLMAAMVISHFLAIGQVEAAYMIAVKRTSLLFGMVYGALWFGESGLWARLAAGSLMVAGVFLVVG